MALASRDAFSKEFVSGLARGFRRALECEAGCLAVQKWGSRRRFRRGESPFREGFFGVACCRMVVLDTIGSQSERDGILGRCIGSVELFHKTNGGVGKKMFLRIKYAKGETSVLEWTCTRKRELARVLQKQSVTSREFSKIIFTGI